MNHHQLQHQLRQRNQQEKLEELRDLSHRDLHLDSDNDGITDVEERLKGTNPHSIDTDCDGRTDLEEINFGTNAAMPNISEQREHSTSEQPELEL